MVFALCWLFCKDRRKHSDFCLIRYYVLVCITVVESVYSAVRTEFTYKADCVSPLKGLTERVRCALQVSPAITQTRSSHQLRSRSLKSRCVLQRYDRRARVNSEVKARN
jgi:hypothetical protein